MKTVNIQLATETVFSDDGKKRYCMRKIWDNNKPAINIIMLVPSNAFGVTLDNSTMLVLNNAYRLGYGSVTILNLFATINDFTLKEESAKDKENIEIIVDEVKKADVTIYAAGVGKAKNKKFQQRQKDVINALKPYEKKLFCLSNSLGKGRLQHPLSPAVREWEISPLKITELLPNEKRTKSKQSKTANKKNEALSSPNGE